MSLPACSIPHQQCACHTESVSRSPFGAGAGSGSRVGHSSSLLRNTFKAAPGTGSGHTYDFCGVLCASLQEYQRKIWVQSLTITTIARAPPSTKRRANRASPQLSGTRLPARRHWWLHADGGGGSGKRPRSGQRSGGRGRMKVAPRPRTARRYGGCQARHGESCARHLQLEDDLGTQVHETEGVALDLLQVQEVDAGLHLRHVVGGEWCALVRPYKCARHTRYSCRPILISFPLASVQRQRIRYGARTFQDCDTLQVRESQTTSWPANPLPQRTRLPSMSARNTSLITWAGSFLD